MSKRSDTVKFNADTSGLKKGTDEVINKLNELNKKLVDNQYKQRDSNKVISDAKRELKKLQEQIKDNDKATDDEKKKIQELNDTIEQEKLKLSQLRTEQISIKTIISETSKEISGNNKEWTVLKATLANLASDTLELLGSKLLSVGKDIIQTGEQFSSSLSEVAAISGATAEELNRMEEAARLYGSTTKFSATEAADALKYMALAGWSAQQSIDGLPAVLDLAAASNMDLGRASDIVTDYITAFGLEVEDAAHFVDIMTYAQNNSNTTTEMLGQAYKNCAATAASMGFTVEEVTAALMTMANAGVKGGEAGTTLNTLMTRLATNAKNCADELGELGVEIYDSQGNMNSLSDILNKMIGAWADLTEKQKNNLSKVIAGTNQYSGFQTVMQGLSDKAVKAGMSFNDYSKALEDCDGTAKDAAKTMSDNLTGDLKALDSALDELKLKIYDDAETPIRNLVKLITKDGIAALDGIIQNLRIVIPIVVGAATALATLKLNLTIGKIVSELTHNTDALKNALKGLTTATEGAAAAQQGLNAAQSANVIGLVITLVMSLISAFGTLAVMTNSNADAAENAKDKAQDYLKSLRDLHQQENQNIENAENESRILKDLQNEYDTLKDKTSLTADEKLRLDSVANELAKTLGVTTQSLLTKDGAYKDITDDIDKYIEKLKEQVKIENATEALKAAYTAYDKASKSAEEYTEKVREQKKAVDEAAIALKKHERKFDLIAPDDTEQETKWIETNRKLTNKLKEEKEALENVTHVWSVYYNQTSAAASSIIENRIALGQTVDEDKELEEMLGHLNPYIEQTTQKIESNTQNIRKNSESVENSVKESEIAAQSVETVSEKYARLNGLLEENKKAVETVNNEIEQAMDSGDEEHLKELQDKLKDLNSEQTILQNRIKAVKEEIDKDSNAIAAAIEKVESSAQMLAKAQKEVDNNGKLSLSTLLQIQKKYPELTDSVNDYISGIKTEKDVINQLKDVYEKDVENYNKALSVKLLKQNGFTQDTAESVVELVNNLKDQYGIDVQNFANASEVKKAALESLKAKAEETQRVFNDFWAENNFDVGMSNGSMYYMAKDPRTNQWREATQDEIAKYKAIVEARNKAYDNYYSFDTNGVQKYMDLYKSVSSGADANRLLDLSDTSSNKSSSKKNTKTITYTSRWKDEVYSSDYSYEEGAFDNVKAADAQIKAYLGVIDRAKNLGKATLNEEIHSLNELLKRETMSADQRYEIRLRLYKAQEQLSAAAAEKEKEAADKAAKAEKDAADALLERQKLALAAYNRIVNNKIDSLKAESDAAKESADKQIAALDKLMAKRKQEQEDAKRQKELDVINAKLRYQQMTDFERRELQRQRQEILNEQAETAFERGIENQKAAISGTASAIQTKNEQAISGLQSSKTQLADRIAYLQGSQTYDQRVQNNSKTVNFTIVQNGLSDDQFSMQIVNTVKKELGV